MYSYSHIFTFRMITTHKTNSEINPCKYNYKNKSHDHFVNFEIFSTSSQKLQKLAI